MFLLKKQTIMQAMKAAGKLHQIEKKTTGRNNTHKKRALMWGAEEKKLKLQTLNQVKFKTKATKPFNPFDFRKK